MSIDSSSLATPSSGKIGGVDYWQQNDHSRGNGYDFDFISMCSPSKELDGAYPM